MWLKEGNERQKKQRPTLPDLLVLRRTSDVHDRQIGRREHDVENTCIDTRSMVCE